jgi:hypothetical protein
MHSQQLVEASCAAKGLGIRCHRRRSSSCSPLARCALPRRMPWFIETPGGRGARWAAFPWVAALRPQRGRARAPQGARRCVAVLGSFSPPFPLCSSPTGGVSLGGMARGKAPFFWGKWLHEFWQGDARRVAGRAALRRRPCSFPPSLSFVLQPHWGCISGWDATGKGPFLLGEMAARILAGRRAMPVRSVGSVALRRRR